MLHGEPFPPSSSLEQNSTSKFQLLNCRSDLAGRAGASGDLSDLFVDCWTGQNSYSAANSGKDLAPIVEKADFAGRTQKARSQEIDDAEAGLENTDL